MLDYMIKNISKSSDLDYGYYGSNAFFLKRRLWWSRLKLANKIYLNYEPLIFKNNLLDFGCHFGFFSAYLSIKFKKIYLIELYEKLLEQGVMVHKKFGNNNYFALMNHEKDSSCFVDKIRDKIDLFLFFDVLEHVRNLDYFIKRLKYIASKDSYVLISLPTENILYKILTKFKKEKNHCNRYFEVENILKKNNSKLIEKRTLIFLFNIYLYKL
jgi:2-polyprenyl-3-methyl-5-hydroxy-6-metoxy-1,4-benzoquinol methylase